MRSNLAVDVVSSRKTGGWMVLSMRVFHFWEFVFLFCARKIRVFIFVPVFSSGISNNLLLGTYHVAS